MEKNKIINYEELANYDCVGLLCLDLKGQKCLIQIGRVDEI